MPLRTGVARMVLGTEGDAAPPGTTLLPIGLTFHEPETFRTGWALVLVGAPVPVEDCRALAAREPERAVRELTARVAEALRDVIVEVEDRETLRLAEGLEAIRRAEAEDAPGAAGRSTSRAERVAWVQVGHARLSLARASRARSGGALPGRGRELPRRSRADRPVAGRRGARVSTGDGPPLRAARGAGAPRRPPARRLGPCEPRAPVLADERSSRDGSRTRPTSRRRQAGRRRRPLSRVLGPRGLGRLPAAGRLGARPPSSWA